MVDRETFELIKRKHGEYASWAVWGPPTGTPKSGMGDMSVLDPDLHATLLETLRNDAVMLGLNRSRSVPGTFVNFHPQYSKAQDYKIRYAFVDTPFYGAYMTDIIKKVFDPKSGSLMDYVRANPSVILDNVQILLEEFDDLKCEAPTLIAFGGSTYQLVKDHVPVSRYARLAKVTHYSHYVSPDDYRTSVLAELTSVGALIPAR